MIERLKRLIIRDAGGVSVKAGEEGIEGFSYDTLWNDYERRTWFYSSRMPDLEHYDSRLLNWIGSIDNSGYVREKCMHPRLRFLGPLQDSSSAANANAETSCTSSTK